jgi:hypothetical protein
VARSGTRPMAFVQAEYIGYFRGAPLQSTSFARKFQ